MNGNRRSERRRQRREPTEQRSGSPGRTRSEEAVAADPAAAARTICLRLLTARARTRHELETAMRTRGIPDDVAASTLERLGTVGLVDDTAYAEMAVRSGHTHRGLGRRALGAELHRRGVPDEIARAAVEAVEPEDEESRARELVQRKLRVPTRRTPDDETALVRRLVGMLGRKGYPEGLAFRVVREEVRAVTGADPDGLDSLEPG